MIEIEIDFEEGFIVMLLLARFERTESHVKTIIRRH